MRAMALRVLGVHLVSPPTEGTGGTLRLAGGVRSEDTLGWCRHTSRCGQLTQVCEEGPAVDDVDASQVGGDGQERDVL